MPKASINKYDDTMPRKNEIGFSEDSLMPAPALNSLGMEDTNQCKFCVLVAVPANTRHHHAAFGLREDVGHCISGVSGDFPQVFD